MNETYDIQRQIALTKSFEGFSGVPYTCPAGYLTIGYGRNLEANPLTPAEGESLLKNDLNKALKEAQKYSWFLTLDGPRQAVIVDMVFNLGARGFSKFRRLHDALQARDWNRAAREMMDSRWRTQVGRRARKLAAMMRAGLWPSDLTRAAA